MVALLPIMVAAMVMAGIGGPVMVDKVAGENMNPDSPFYGVEKIGEGIQKALGVVKNSEIAQERLMELEQMRIRTQERIRMILDEVDVAIEESNYQEAPSQVQNLLQERNEILNRVMSQEPNVELKEEFQNKLDMEFQNGKFMLSGR